MNPLQPMLDQSGVIILDGALATELERRGANLNDPLWSAKILAEAPDLIRQVHYDYFVAGADIATTASYQASFPGFARRGLNKTQAAALMRLSVQLASEARDQFSAEPKGRPRVGNADSMPDPIPHSALPTPHSCRPLVAASIGPYGAYLADGSEYRGDYGLTVEQLMDFHRPRLQVLANSGADLLACETIPCWAEAEALVTLLQEFPQTVAWLSFSCRDGEHVCHGERLADCVALAERSAQIVAVGVNCTPPRFVEALLHHAAPATTKPLLAYPNSGEIWDSATHCWLPGTGVTEFSEPARLWYNAGARLIGGCCRTTPMDIQTMAHVLRKV